MLHTFHRNGCRTNCFQECVSRTRTQEWYCFFTSGKLKCSVNGDLLCDTDADPSNLKGVAWDCNSYTITNQTEAADACAITDNYGSPWLQTPNNNALNNLMTYQFFSNVVCNQITPMQQGVMYHYINKANNYMKYNSDVDAYENDNFYQTSPFSAASNCNIANINSKQYHAFHHSKGSACDVDWVYFTNSSLQARPFIIQTSEVSGKPKPDTKITLYSINSDGTLGSQIAFNDNISTTNLFSNVTTGNLASSGNFALKIENNIADINDTRSKGHYYLRIDDCMDKSDWIIDGPNNICYQSSTYFINGTYIPTNGISYQWSTSSNLSLSVASMQPNMSSVSIPANQPAIGRGWIKCLITFSNGCSQILLDKEVDLFNGNVAPNPIVNIKRGDICPKTVKDFEVSYNHKNHFVLLTGTSKNISSCTWTVNGGYIINDMYNVPGSSHRNIFVNGAIGSTLSITVNGNYNDCSSFEGSKSFSITNKMCTDFDDVARVAYRNSNKNQSTTLTLQPIKPNPANTKITCTFIFDEQDQTKASKEELDFKLSIYNIFGKLIKEIHTASLSTEIDISTLEKGIYIVNSIINNQVFVEKFAKE